jgi:hypothetical protein
MFSHQNQIRIPGKSLLIVLCVALGSGSAAHSQTQSAIRNEFRQPAKKFRPMVRWWWPGGDVTDDEIKREIGLLDSAGFGGAEIQPLLAEIQPFPFQTGSLPKDEVDRLNDFPTPAFFNHVRIAADAAKLRGMWIDDTFGSGWPFGGGLAITPELSSIELRFADNVVAGPKPSLGKLTIPQWQPGLIAELLARAGMKPEWPAGWEARFEARSKIVAVVAMRSVSGPKSATEKNGPQKPEMLDRSSAIILTDRLKADGTLDWQVPDGTWHIFVFRQIPTRQPVFAGAGTGPQLMLDHLNKAAFTAHAARVGDPLIAAAGSDAGLSLRAIFCDSLEIQEYIFWSDDFLDQFKKRRGYDLTPYLPLLHQPGYNDSYRSYPGGLPLFDIEDRGDAIRRDYWKTVSELIFDNFYHPFDEWAKQHKLLSRVQAHGAPGDLLKLYGDASIPETEQLFANGTVNFMKLSSSAGYDYGRRVVSSESFIFEGNPYVTTPESIVAITDKMLISGVNQIIYSGFPYKFDLGPPAVGWYPFQGQYSSPIDQHTPIWPFMGKVNQYIARLQYIAQTGTSDLQVAIFRSSLNDDDTGPTPASGPVKDPFPAIEESLTTAGLSYGFVNEDALLGGSAKDATVIAKGGGRYTALLIPHETLVSPELVRTLQAFIAAKVPIVFVGGLPGANVSFKDLDENREKVARGLQDFNHASSALQAVNSSDAASRLASIIQPQVRFISGQTFPFLEKTIGSTRFYFLTNPEGKRSSAKVEFDELGSPELWDPWTGNVQRASFIRNNGHANMNIDLPPFGSELIAFSEVGPHLPPPHSVVWQEFKKVNIGVGGWSVDAIGESEKGVGIQLHLNLTDLVDWLTKPELRTFSGKATYVTHFSVSPDDFKSANRVVLNLGEVKDAAEVKVNGASAGQLVIHPFSVNIRQFLHPGENEIAITVVNSLTNYVSSVQVPESPLGIGHFPPVSSGLLGPVTLAFEKAESNLSGQ